MENDSSDLVKALQMAPLHQDPVIHADYANEYMKLFLDCYKHKVKSIAVI
jgi:hypothetical protein